jgi:hypothetical protein
MLTVIQVNLRDGADKVRVAKRLYAKNQIHLVMLRSFSNLPNFLHGLISSDKMSEIRKLLSEIGEDEDVLAVTPNLLHLERMYTTFDTKLLLEGSKRLSEKVRRHGYLGRGHNDPGR